MWKIYCIHPGKQFVASLDQYNSVDYSVDECIPAILVDNGGTLVVVAAVSVA